MKLTIKTLMAVVIGIVIVLLAINFILMGFGDIPGLLLRNMTENATSVFPGF